MLNESQAVNYQQIQQIQQILGWMNFMCVAQSTAGQQTRPRKHDKRLLRGMGVHSVALDLLQIPYD